MIVHFMVMVAIFVSAVQAFCQTSGSSALPASAGIDITARVLNVRQIGFPRVKIDLQVIEGPSIHKLSPGVITAENYIWTVGGNVDWANVRNIGSVAAYYLLPGDEIRAKLFAGVAGTSGSAWYVYGISRRGAVVPPTPGIMPKVTSTYGNLLLVLEADAESYRRGESVTLTLTLSNTGKEDLVYKFSSGQHYDIVISGDNKELWRWSRGKAFIQAFTSLTLKPGESKVFKEVWRQTTSSGKSVPEGEYTVTAYLTLGSPTKPTVGPLRIKMK